MKIKGKIFGLVMILGLLMALSGCTSADGIRLSKALTNQLDLKSAEGTANLSVNVKLQGFSNDEQTQKVVDIINASTISIDSKSDMANNKSYLKGSVDLSGVTLNGMVYSDGQKTWIKMPTEPKYIEINPKEFVQGTEDGQSYKNALEMQEKIKPLAIKFVKDYFSEYKYTFKNLKNKGLATISTPEGQKEVTLIEVKLDNDELSKFVDYTIKNLAQSDSLKDYIKSVIEISAKSDPYVIVSPFVPTSIMSFIEFTI
jgi:hypothetical protein